MFRNKNLVLWFVFAAVGAFLVGKYAVLARSPQTTPRPFMIEMQERVFAGSNPQQLIGEFHFVYAVRSDGSHVYANIQKDGEAWKILSRRLELVTDMKTALVSDFSGFVSSFKMSLRKAEILTKPRSLTTCEGAGHTVAGEDFILGYRVEKLQKVNQAAIVERWAAPDLQCHVLKSRLQVKRPDGTIASTSEENALSVREGEPPAELFEINSNFVEAPPSKLFTNNKALSPPDTDEGKALRMKLEKVDEAYNLHRHEGTRPK